MPERRRIKLIREGGSQVVPIPIGLELPGDEVTIYRDGDRLVLEPSHRHGLIALLKATCACRLIDDTA